MKKRHVLLAVVAALSLLAIFAASASASTIATASDCPPSVQPWFQRWVDEDQAPSPRGYVTIVCDQNSGNTDYTHTNPGEPRTIHWYEEGFGANPEELRLDFYIELGNVFQFTLVKPGERYMKIHFYKVFKPNQPAKKGLYLWREMWDWFGMSYVSCASGVEIPTPEFYGFEYNPTLEQQRKACTVTEKAWQIHGLERASTTSEANEKFEK